MVPDTPDETSDRVATAGVDTPNGRGPADGPADDTYDVVYRATRDALWDVVGTATLLLFHLALAALGVSLAVGGVGPFVRGSGSVTGLAVGVVALVVGGFAAVRAYRLATE